MTQPSGWLRDRSRAALTTGPTLAAFRVPGYPALWLSSSAAVAGSAVALVAIGWLALEVSDSALAVGATFAARFLPALVLGIPLGGLVDRYDRRRTLVAVFLVAMAPLVGAGLLADAGRLGLAALLGLSLLLGLIDMVRGSATQAYASAFESADRVQMVGVPGLGVRPGRTGWCDERDRTRQSRGLPARNHRLDRRRRCPRTGRRRERVLPVGGVDRGRRGRARPDRP